MNWFLTILAAIMIVLSFWGKTDEQVKREEEYEQLILERYENSIVNSRDSLDYVCKRDSICVQNIK